MCTASSQAMTCDFIAVNNAVQHTSHYTGLDCQPGSEYPGNICSLPASYCQYGTASNCTWWKHGFYSATKTADKSHLDERSSTSQRQPEQPRCIYTDYSGAFVNSTWQPLRRANCKYFSFDANEARSCLHGRRIVFSGDSLMRQVFLRLISHLRGLPSVIEHYFQMNALFEQRGNMDHFRLGNWTVEHLPLPPDSFDLIYLWAPHNVPVRTIRHLGADHVMSGVIYWDETDLQGADGLWESLVYLEQPNEQLQKFYWLATPPPVLPLNLDVKIVESRNTYMREWVASRIGGTDFHLIGYDKMETMSPWLRNEGDIHFGCMFWTPNSGSMFPNPIHNDSFRTPLDQDCRSLMNYNIFNVMLNNLCSDP